VFEANPTVRRASLLLAAAAALSLAGCSADDEGRLPRPPIPIPISVAVDEDEVRISPDRVAIPGQRPVNINQNANAAIGQARQVEDATVVFTVSNRLDRPARLFVEGPAERVEPIASGGTADFQMALPTGIYRLSAPGVSGTGRLTVGPSRVSSGTSVLTP
jgi:hypothetical protein